MAAASKPDTDELLRGASRGDRSAVDGLFARHRDRLRQMVVIRMDSRIKARVDPSDVHSGASELADRPHFVLEIVDARDIAY